MKTTRSILLLIAAFVGVTCALPAVAQSDDSQDPGLQFDNPAVLDSIIAPYAAMARRTYPEAKARFQKGLPQGEKFLITTRVFDVQGNFQQIFVEVHGIANNKVDGIVAMAGTSIPDLAPGRSFSCPEQDVLDWCIVKPDGSQEGNVVGKYLEVVQQRIVGLMLEIVIARNGTVSSAKCVRALSKSQQDVTFCVPDAVMRRAEDIARTIKYDPQDSAVTKYTYIVYDYVMNRIQEPNRDQTTKAGESTGPK